MIYSGEEAYAMVAGEMYYPDEIGYQPPEVILKDLDEKVVESAEQYAEEHSFPWPPRATGMIAWIATSGR